MLHTKPMRVHHEASDLRITPNRSVSVVLCISHIQNVRTLVATTTAEMTRKVIMMMMMMLMTMMIADYADDDRGFLQICGPEEDWDDDGEEGEGEGE